MLEPTSKWQVSMGAERCRVTRNFGSDGKQVVLSLSRFRPTDSFYLLIAGHRFNFRNSGPGNGLVSFGNAKAENAPFFKGRFRKKPAMIYRKNFRIAAAQDANFMAIGKPLSRKLRLNSGPMKIALQALSRCTDRLIAKWGFDSTKYHKQSRAARPLTSPSTWIGSDAYPKIALWARQKAIVTFRLNVNREGKPTACKIQQATVQDHFNKAVCQNIMAKAAFKPALDENGQPVDSFWSQAVIFNIKS